MATTNTVLRAYSCSNFDMLTVSSIILSHAVANQDFLITRRARWADPYFANVQTRINGGFDTVLVSNPKLNLRKKSSELKKVQHAALKGLGDLHIQIKEDNKEDPEKQKELMDALGFAAFFKKARAKSQGALISQLFTIKLAMLDKREQLIADGISPLLLDEICAYAETMNTVNIEQESLKGSTKEITAETTEEFNAIYSEVMSIAKIARRFFLDDPLKRELFNFTKTLKKLHAKGTAATSPAGPAETPAEPAATPDV